MGLIKKIISVSQPPQRHPAIFGVDFVYPAGTIRIIKRFNLFFGWRYFEQVADIGLACSLDDCVTFNTWKTIRQLTEHQALLTAWTFNINNETDKK